MSAKHTPGPWEVAGYNVHDCTHEVTTAVRPESERELIAGVAAYPHPPRSTEAEANARLIAAAPDLLKAAKAVARFTLDDLDIEGWQEAMDRLDAAIAKAEGR